MAAGHMRINQESSEEIESLWVETIEAAESKEKKAPKVAGKFLVDWLRIPRQEFMAAFNGNVSLWDFRYADREEQEHVKAFPNEENTKN